MLWWSRYQSRRVCIVERPAAPLSYTLIGWRGQGRACEHKVILLEKLRPSGCVNTALGLTTMQGYCTMAKRPLPTPEQLRQLLRYDPETGKLYWLPRPIEMFGHCTPAHQERVRAAWNGAWAGKEAGYTDDYGYISVTLFHHRRNAHRIAWCIVHGEWPKLQIDHINGIRGDNRIVNLRVVTHAENQQNMRLSRVNTSGVTGVYWCARTKKWRAEVICNRRRYRLGRFSDLQEASRAVEAKRRLLGIPTTHGKQRAGYDEWRAQSR